MIEWCTGMLFLSLFSVQFPFVTLFLARRFFDKTLFHFLGLAHDGTINLYSACKNRSVLLQKFLQILALFHLPFCLSPNLLRAETEGVSQSAQQWFWVGLHLPPSRLYISLAVFVWVDLLMFFQISQLHNSNSGLLDHSYLRFLMLFQGPVKWPKWQTWTARVSCVVNRRMYVALEHWLSIWALLWLSLFELLTAYSCKEANTSGLRPDSTVHIHTSHLQKYIYISICIYVPSSIIFWYSHPQKPIALHWSLSPSLTSASKSCLHSNRDANGHPKSLPKHLAGDTWHFVAFDNEIWTRWRDGMNRSEMIEMFKSWQCECAACGGIVEICDSLLQRSLLLGSKSCKEPCDGSSSRSCESQTMTLTSQVGNSGLHRDGNLEQAVTSGNKR